MLLSICSIAEYLNDQDAVLTPLLKSITLNPKDYILDIFNIVE